MEDKNDISFFYQQYISPTIFQNLNAVCQAQVLQADISDSDSILYLCRSFLEGINNFPQNIEIGIKYLEKAVELENVEAMELFGTILFKGELIPKDEEKAIEVLNQAIIKSNSSYAKFTIAQIQYSCRTCGPNGFDDSNVDYVISKKLSKEAADDINFSGNVDAMVLYATLCEKEKKNKFGSITRDFNEAFKYFKRATDLGNIEAMALYGIYYKLGLGVVKIDNEKAVKYFKKASQRGSLTGSELYGGMLIDGKGVAKNEKEGLRLVKFSCDRGNPQGMIGYGYTLYYGDCGIESNKEMANHYFKMAADAGNHWGMNNYAADLQFGEGIEKNFNEAIRYYKMAIEEGNMLAAKTLGKLICNGEPEAGMLANPVEGNKYIKYAADHGNVLAIEDFVSNIVDEKGITFNIELLRSYLKLGIEAQSTYCIAYYGAMLLDGDQFPQNLAEGARFMRMAADLGDSYAMYTLAQLLESGSGVSKNLVEARKYYKLSADLGDKDGIDNYARFLEEGIGGVKHVEEALKYRKLLSESE
ncbi:hypothetical protein M9Y10_041301 [Tritrichomonas musculus]|uniref:Uncharacterized protein n=1 Tax=Tritrichomonas musculus TaxID=1915356 RepID=A0ABR2K517_9EUKA